MNRQISEHNIVIHDFRIVCVEILIINSFDVHTVEVTICSHTVDIMIRVASR